MHLATKSDESGHLGVQVKLAELQPGTVRVPQLEDLVAESRHLLHHRHFYEVVSSSTEAKSETVTIKRLVASNYGTVYLHVGPFSNGLRIALRFTEKRRVSHRYDGSPLVLSPPSTSEIISFTVQRLYMYHCCYCSLVEIPSVVIPESIVIAAELH